MFTKIRSTISRILAAQKAGRMHFVLESNPDPVVMKSKTVTNGTHGQKIMNMTLKVSIDSFYHF